MDEKSLIHEFKKGNNREGVFQNIMLKYQEAVYWHIRRMVVGHDDTNDLVQNVFITVWDKLDGFRGDSSLYTWIYRIATNEALAHIRKNKRLNRVDFTEAGDHLKRQVDNGSHISGDEIQRRLHKAILELPEKQQLVFNMKYFDNMKYEEISRVLDTSVGALKASYHHAVRKIEKWVVSG